MSALIRLLVASFGVIALTGCNDVEQNRDIRQQGFVYCGQGNPTTFNPQLTDGGITVETLGAQIFDRLLELDPVSHQPMPNLAKGWSVNEEGTVYSFTLRKGVEFQKTQWFTPTRTLNADDVVFSFERLINPDNAYYHVGNTRYPWFESIDFKGSVAEIKAISSHEIEFHLTRPDNTFLSNIATGYAVIHSKEYAQNLIAADRKNFLDSHPVGTGAFYLEEYQSGDLIRLKRHLSYWRGMPPMEQIVFDISSRGTGTLAKFLSGECDVLSAPVASQLPAITKERKFNLEAQTAMNVAFIALDTNHKALKDPRVRKALNLAINRENILNSVYYGTGTQARTILPPSSWAYQQDSIQIRYDMKLARALLAEAGYESGLSLTMWVPLESRPYNPSPRKAAELIQADFADVGIELELVTQDRFERTHLSDENRSDLILTGWIADNGDPDNFLRPLLSCNAKQAGLNVAMWCNPDFDTLLDLARETNQLRHRLNLYHQAQNVLNELMPIIPIAHGIQYQASHQSLQGFQMSPFGTRSFSQVYRSE
ncbi:peptide ABC transporter substrate-binding protein SapA [Vibrio sp. Of7-15]|uniref:ABC transporter substrate-binding protein SapA n=1 Tax=Vibrio sp. Of7-15 TaxID=2724879 RepID=UPI001EF35732|nr:ABC transporter substrate-binding protein SapA [Vibrio sp. Of7-15]MCG7496109.1 peptide ABC transporter substrate-binding protein SapA [Vibrio sp. Of7-15]